ncbi:MAG TPA: hypothetical protein VKN18_16615, partial [Blastocatellia bacterium]|nr:hypothetical protein [Blastocatellia bacterium]
GDSTMSRSAWVWASGLTCLVLLRGPAIADDLEAQMRALKIISSFAGETCGEALPLEGSSTHVELSGDVKAQLAGVIAKVADLGISGAGKYKDDKFKSVLHEQLAEAFRDRANCKLKVFEVLQEKMIK